jgi:hypothetical protein
VARRTASACWFCSPSLRCQTSLTAAFMLFVLHISSASRLVSSQALRFAEFVRRMSPLQLWHSFLAAPIPTLLRSCGALSLRLNEILCTSLFDWHLLINTFGLDIECHSLFRAICSRIARATMWWLVCEFTLSFTQHSTAKLQRVQRLALTLLQGIDIAY